MDPAAVEHLSKQFGDNLRSIGYYDGDQAELVYVRDDVESGYDAGDVDDVLQDIVLEALDQRHQESLYSHGGLQCTVRCFEDATELHFVEEQTKGVVVAVDAGTIGGLRVTIDACLETIAEA